MHHTGSSAGTEGSFTSGQRQAWVSLTSLLGEIRFVARKLVLKEVEGDDEGKEVKAGEGVERRSKGKST